MVGAGAWPRVHVVRTRLHRSAVLAVGVGLFIEWHFFPFAKDGSFGYFITHIHERHFELIMIALGGVFAFWFGIGRTPVRRQEPKTHA